MIAHLAVLLLPASAWADDTTTLFRGPGTYAASFVPAAVGQYQSSTGGGSVQGGTTLLGVGFGTRVSLVTLLADPERGLFPADFLGLDLVVGGRTGVDSGAWVIARGDAGVGLVFRADGLEAWLRVGGYLGIDTGFGTNTGFGSWLIGIGSTVGPVMFEIVPGVGAQSRLSQARVLVGLGKSIWHVGFLAEHLAERDYPNRRASTRGMALIVMR